MQRKNIVIVIIIITIIISNTSVDEIVTEKQKKMTGKI